MRLRCDRCGKEVVVVFRSNPIGEKGVWWCKECMTSAGLAIDPAVKEVTAILARELDSKNSSSLIATELGGRAIPVNRT
jgi:ribosomal protein L37AE/L43A